MNFRVEHFYKLLPYTFNIPSYQRGYRWEKKQVIDLLEDLKEFVIHIQNDTVNDGEFYSLQPVVVQRRDKENEFDLVDGQQRLTTLFLIMSFLSDVRRLLSKDTTMYSLIYDSRKEDIDFLRDKLFTQDDNEKKKKKFIAALDELNRKTGIPDKLVDLKRDDIAALARHADKEANPLYPVPKEMNATELAEIYKKVLAE